MQGNLPGGDARSDVQKIIENVGIPAARIIPCLFSADVNIEELARLAVDGCSTRDDLQSFIAEADDADPGRDANAGDFRGVASARLFALMRMQFYRYIGQFAGEKLFDFTASLLGRREPVMAQALGRIAYVKSPAADNAFLQFSSSGIVANPRAVYFNGFPDVCEEVYNGLCEYCVLPLDNTRDGKLRGFCSLIDKYDLQIRCICDVPSPDRSVSTGMALLRKRGFDSSEEITKFPADALIEVSVEAGTFPSVTDILSAAAFCKMEPAAIDTVPASGGSDIVTMRFPLKGADLPTFLLFLSFETPHCNVTGLFRKIRIK